MKLRILLSLIAIFIATNADCQVEFLRPSPAQKIIQKVGLTNLEIEFSRPQMKGRTIFGGLVPYNKMWRTGANENTTLSFDHRVKMGETEVAEGKYALFTKPTEKEWAFYLYTETGKFGIPDPIDESKLIYLTTVNSKALSENEETLVINIYDITETSATLGIRWEKTAVDVPITFYTREVMEKMMTQAFEQNIADYAIVSNYYSKRDIELEKAKELRELAMSLEEPNAWDYHAYGLILNKLGDKEKAISNFKTSLKLATEAENNYIIGKNEKMLKLLE